MSRILKCHACGEEVEGIPLRGFAGVRQSPWLEETWYWCGACGACFCDRRTTEAEDVQHHQMREHGRLNRFERYRRIKRPMYRHVCAGLEKRFEQHGLARRSILDVGASFGGFLTEAQAAGFKVTASDINPECVSYIKAQGVEAYSASSLSQLPKLCFDAITMLDVAGYFDNQRAEFERAREMLSEGGWLVIRTTNKLWMVRLAMMLSRFARQYGRRLFNRAVVDTVYVQDTGTLCRLLRDCGFKRVEIEPDATYHAQSVKLDAKAAYATGTLFSKVVGRPVIVPGVFVWAQCSSNGQN